ncbi:MAG: hypothetical protein ACLPKI_08370 [Streptosporangiaceae bacterium]
MHIRSFDRRRGSGRSATLGCVHAKAQAAAWSYAIDHDLTLKQAALAKGVSEDLYDKVVIPLALTRPGTADVPPGSGKA